VAVPDRRPTLTFNARWNEEDGFDVVAVQISADGGGTYTSVACTDTTASILPDAWETARAILPAFNGTSDWSAQSCDLSDHAGETVVLAFRAVDDFSILGNGGGPPGLWADDIAVGDRLIDDGSSLTGWSTPSNLGAGQ